MRTVLHQEVPGLGRVTLGRVDPAADAPLIHEWVTRPANRFWGMAEYTVDDVRDVYAFLDGLSTHQARLIALGGRPIGIFQTYEPEHDPVAERYPVQPGDIGVHLLLAPGPRPARGLTAPLAAALLAFVFADPAVRRIVVEPDARNAFALRRLALLGFTFGEEIDMPDKRARLAFITGERVVSPVERRAPRLPELPAINRSPDQRHRDRLSG